MTYREIRRKQKKISEYRIRIEVLKAKAESTTTKLSPTTGGSGVGDKVGEFAAQIYEISKNIETLEDEIRKAIDSLPDTLEGNCIRLKICRRYSWRKISFVLSGSDNAESVKKMCQRYSW